MTTLELEQLIEGQAESPNLDFKQDCIWDAKKMAKDFIAMSNLKAGGYIVVGVREDGSNFIGEGVSEDNIESYKVDIMRDQMFKYADPAVDIRVDYPTDSKGNKYVVIKVLSFKEIPVLSKTDIQGELIANMLYYRNTNRRVESAPVSNAHDLRDIIELAAVKLMQRRKNYGFNVESQEFQILDQEISKLPESGILNKIKSRGFWEIRFQPLQLGNLQKLSDCMEVIEKSQVRLNWSFPWIPRRNDENERLHPSDSCYEAESEWGARKEFWRMYQSEQFIMYSALTEDWYEEDSFRKNLVDEYPPGKFVTLYTSIVHLITQCISFAERLAGQGLYKNGLKITMTLNKMRCRQLNLDASGRYPFIESKITMATQIKLDEEFSIEQLTQDSTSISNKYILKTTEYFRFHPSADGILKEQIEFLKGN